MSRPISYFIVGLLVLGAAACTKPNPLDCSDGTCTDPGHPFCDVDGSLGDGTEATCIAVSCTPGTFATCRGDSALACNPAGTSYDLTQCADGCDPTAGCRLCEANQTVCANGTLQTCDAAGAITASETCPLGCFQDQPRCRDIDPSNGLGKYLDMAADAPDLVLVDGDVIYTDTHQLAHGTNPPFDLPVPWALTAAQAGGAQIRVLIANHVQITGTVHVGLFHSYQPGPALAIVANKDIHISGTLDFAAHYLEGLDPILLPGSVTFAGCVGGPASVHIYANIDDYTGSGGGGHATGGARGGKINNVPFDSGAGGQAMGAPTLVPLRGGCAGGGDVWDSVFGPVPSTPFFASGGGAVQLSSRTAIAIDNESTINLNGSPANGQGGMVTNYGGGAGGGILLEAPILTLGSATRLLVNGGAGVTGNGEIPQTSLTTAVTDGGTCVSRADLLCSARGGNGASADGPATSGTDVDWNPDATKITYYPAAGGGGLGYIRINTATGHYSKSSDTTESGVLTTGTIGTR